MCLLARTSPASRRRARWLLRLFCFTSRAAAISQTQCGPSRWVYYERDEEAVVAAREVM